ncbi:hypothetical protein G3A43_07715 [Paraburkholderia aspalathi]|nr:hypothetical protein [Paraburkholderia aspalathi]MBK3780142.1 hypothetical protein [Paraburkholderia aspalathi]
MKFSTIYRTKGTTVSGNLSLNPSEVKASSKLTMQLLAVFVFAMLSTGFSPAAHARASDDARVRAIRNTELLSTMMHGVLPEQMPVMVDNIATGKVQRFAPEQPVWIIDASTGTILYYQGNTGFAGQPASKLVDDNGVRFGQKAIDSAKNSKATWLTLHLGGQSYPAYCSEWAPTVVCSLAVPKK